MEWVPPIKFSKRGERRGEGGGWGVTGKDCWERGGDFFEEGGGLQFLHKK